MPTKRQYEILNACADDWEIFYFPFAHVSYGGPVFPREVGDGYAQYVDDRQWPVSVPAEAIAADIVVLVAQGLLQGARVSPGDFKREMLGAVGSDELSMYAGYRCLTFDDHIASYGYGPYEFMITEAGVKEINAPDYANW